MNDQSDNNHQNDQKDPSADNAKKGPSPTPTPPTSSAANFRRIFCACLVVLSVAISTGYGSQLKYSLLNADSDHFYPPFVMMWFNNSCLIICFPLYVIVEKLKGTKRSLRQICEESARIFSGDKCSICYGLYFFSADHRSEDTFHFGQFSVFLAKELFFLLLYTVTNYSYAISLGRISSSAALTVRSFDVFLVYILGRLLLNEQFFLLKTLAVFLAMGGVLLIALDHQFAADFVGVLLVLFSASADAIYKVGFKWMAGSASLGEGMFFLSGMALVNAPANAVPSALLLQFGVERWEWPSVPWGPVIGFVLLTFLFNIVNIFGVAFLNPLIISIGILCGVPISIGIDVIFRGHHPSPGFLIGAVSLATSVAIVTFHEHIQRGISGKCGRKNTEEQQEEKI